MVVVSIRIFRRARAFGAHRADTRDPLFPRRRGGPYARGGNPSRESGGFAHMPPFLNHAIVAKTPLMMLLLMMKGLKREKSD